MMGKKLVCLCNLVEEKEIVQSLKKGAASVDEVMLLTGAGRSCGRCLPEIDELVVLHKNQEPKDLQQKLDFGFRSHEKV